MRPGGHAARPGKTRSVTAIVRPRLVSSWRCALHGSSTALQKTQIEFPNLCNWFPTFALRCARPPSRAAPTRKCHKPNKMFWKMSDFTTPHLLWKTKKRKAGTKMTPSSSWSGLSTELFKSRSQTQKALREKEKAKRECAHATLKLGQTQVKLDDARKALDAAKARRKRAVQGCLTLQIRITGC
jgi:hypothetical protein